MQVCEYAHICKYASMKVCKYVCICKYATMHTCKYAGMKVCKYARGHLVREQRGRLIRKGPLPKDKFMKALGIFYFLCVFFISVRLQPKPSQGQVKPKTGCKSTTA